MATPTTPLRPPDGRPAPPSRRKKPPSWREGLAGYVFLSPFLVGLMGITAIPMLYSLYLSFTDYELLAESSKWIGMRNYADLLTNDTEFWHAVRVTITFAVVAVPLKLLAALGVAMLLNRERRGTGIFRGLFYLPSLLGGSVAIAIIWQAMFDRSGAFNSLLALFGFTGEPWVNDPDWALQTLMLLAIWQFGAPMVIFLAGLKQIPHELYEAAAVDGASPWRRFRSITLPMLSPVIFFNLVLETIGGFQGFTAAFVISNGTGGPTDSTLMYTLQLYLKAFTEFEMGYASAMAWLFLVTIGLLTVVLFTTGRFWVHYADEEGS